jgi:predicted transcriptional regulator
VTNAITLRIGIASREQIKRRSIDIAAGRRRPGAEEPRIWFTSLDAILRVLSDKNMSLLELIRNSQPASLSELAARAGMQKSNLSRTLRKLEQFGFVDYEVGEGGRKAPRVNYDAVAFERPLGPPRSRAA